jgi:cytochrome c556
MSVTMPQMTTLQNRRVRSRVAFACATLLAGITFLSSGTLAQEQAAATPADAIMARKSVMDALSEKMDLIEAAVAAGKVNLDAAHTNADTISIFLMAFPHLFPPATNQWKAGGSQDPLTDTSASPEIWAKFDDFYKQAAAASKSAYDASRAANENDLKKAVSQLRTQCNDCHASYLKTN